MPGQTNDYTRMKAKSEAILRVGRTRLWAAGLRRRPEVLGLNDPVKFWLGTFGMSKANPGLLQIDASLLKNTHIPWMGEQSNLQLRFDFLNLFNHVNLGGVDSFMGDASFGKVTSALSARQIQLGARISF